MKKVILLIGLLMILLAGCSPVQCNKPYIRVGIDCCLDEDENDVCDKDQESQTAMPAKTITSNKVAVQEENKDTSESESSEKEVDVIEGFIINDEFKTPSNYRTDKSTNILVTYSSDNPTKIMPGQNFRINCSIKNNLEEDIDYGAVVLRGLDLSDFGSTNSMNVKEIKKVESQKVYSIQFPSEGYFSSKPIKGSVTYSPMCQFWYKKGEDNLVVSGSGTLEVQQVSDRISAMHILVGTSSEAYDLIRILDETPKQDLTAKFKELVMTYSEDSSSKYNQGDLGYFSKGQMVSEFEDAAFDLDFYEYTTTPVKTQFGYHIILRTG